MSTRIVLIGAGSSVFSYNSILDASNLEVLQGCNLVLHDINEKKLNKIGALAEMIIERTDSTLEVELAPDRADALFDADFVLLSIAIDRMNRWQIDWEIPFNHGIKQVLGENGGLGGLFHTMRNIPPVLAICNDIENYCPDALLMNYTNPVSRLCLAINRYTNVNVVGLCHEVEDQLRNLSNIMGVPRSLLEAVSAGLNHFSWFKNLSLTNGDDAYPFLDEALQVNRGFQPLCQAIYNRFGLYPSTDDNHIGEYLAYAWQACPEEIRGLNWINRMRENRIKNWQKIHKLIESEEPLNVTGKLSGERAMNIIGGIISNSGHIELQANLPNKGQIPNLPKEAIVETPAIVNRNGVSPITVGDLPEGIAALVNIQILVQELAVEAGVSGDKDLALQAALADPVVHDMDAGKRAFEDLMEAHVDLLPQFS
jgi:alpha-galactosidase